MTTFCDGGELKTEPSPAVVEIDGKPWVVGKDVAVALGYKDTTNAVKQHCRGVVKRHLTDNLGRDQAANFISEGDIYRLAAKSELPGAKKFRRWVTSEVLPSIKETDAVRETDGVWKDELFQGEVL